MGTNLWERGVTPCVRAWELYLWELMGTLCGVTPCVRAWELMGTYGNFVRSNSVRVRGNLWELMGTLCGVTPCVRPCVRGLMGIYALCG